MTLRATTHLALAAALFASSCKRDEPALVTATFEISPDGRALEVKRVSDPEVARLPILDKCGNPAVGEHKIRNVRASEKERLSVTYGKHCYATVLLESLTVTCDGCD